MIDMTITVACDGCENEKAIDLDDGDPWVDYETKIDNALEAAGWYTNADGEWCPKCAHAAKARWDRTAYDPR